MHMDDVCEVQPRPIQNKQGVTAFASITPNLHATQSFPQRTPVGVSSLGLAASTHLILRFNSETQKPASVLVNPLSATLVVFWSLSASFALSASSIATSQWIQNTGQKGCCL